MNFVEAIQSGFSNYVNFSGRAQRSAYWWWALFYFIVLIVAEILDSVIFGSPVLYLIITLALLLPTIALGVRRLHDTDRSGWWLLIAFIPLIGAIVLIVFFVQKGTTGPNRFGPDPLGGA
jgi:uncharacterized membrane protein YhaH (DUF805 family)